MGIMSSLSTIFENREDLVLRVADTAEYLRRGRDSEPTPICCPYICDATHRIAWGRGTYCTNCGLPALSGWVWHGILVGLLRAATPTTISEVAA